MKKYNAEEWKTKQEETKEKLKTQVADIVTNFENDPEDILEFLHFSSQFYQYSTNNKMLIYRQNPGARFCASYNKLKEMGYQVQRGQKGMEILVPAAVTYWYDDNTSQWKRLSEAKKEEKAKIKAGEIETKKITVFKIGHTFDIGQTDCPVAEYPKLFGMGYSSEKHDELFNAVKSYCEERRIPVYIENFPSISMRGYFQPADNTIHLSDKLNDSMKLSVLTHELGHAVMHAAYDPDMSVEQKEIEADSLSLMLREHLGVSEIENARKAHLADSYRNYLEYKELNSDRIKCPELPEILDRVNTAYGDMITGFNGAIESYLHREKEEIKELNPALTAESNKKIANEITRSIGRPLPKEESLIDYDNSICYSPRNVNTEKEKIKLLNPSAEQISLVAAYEEAYNVPSDERLTVYSGDYMIYETAEHASAEKFNSAVSTALEKLGLSETEFEAADYSKKQLAGFFKKIIENEKENEQFKSDLIKWQNGEYPATEVIKVCSTPYVMQACGIEAHDIVIKNNTLRKITSDDKEEFIHAHNMNIGELYQIPNAIRNPDFILKGSHQNSVVFISNEFNSNGERIIIPCTLNSVGKNCTVHRIMSVYGKENFEIYLKKEIEKNSLMAYNKKVANEITRSIGLYLPKEESLIDYNDSICYSPRNVNTEKEKIKLLNPSAEQISLVAAYEEAYNVPSDERLTVYSGDYMIYETAEHASAEKFNSAVSTALEKLGLSETEFEAADYSKKQLAGFFKKIIENEKENEQFKSDLIKWQNGDYPATEMLKVSSTPYVMQACGIEAHDIYIKQNTLKKVMSNNKEEFPHAHNVSMKELYQIPNIIRNPVMILKGEHPNAVIFVSNMFDSDNHRIIIPCTLNIDVKRYTAHRIMSIYGKNHLNNYLKNKINKGAVLAYNKKIASEMIQSIGHPLPKEESLIDYDNSICYSPRNVNTEKEKRLIKDLKQMILRDETSPEAVLSDRSAQNWYSFTCQASGTDDIKNSLKRLVTDEMKIVAVQDFDAGSKTVQLTPDFQLQFIGTGYSNHREALSAVLGDSSVAKIVDYDMLKNAAENHDFKIISEAENIKYPYVIFENSNSEIRRMPIRDALKELEEKNIVAVEKQSYEAVDISIVADRDNVYSMQAELGTPRSVTEQIQAYCDDLRVDGLGRETALQKYINNNHAAEMNFSARDQIMFDGFDIGR